MPSFHNIMKVGGCVYIISYTTNSVNTGYYEKLMVVVNILDVLCDVNKS